MIGTGVDEILPSHPISRYLAMVIAREPIEMSTNPMTTIVGTIDQ